MFTWICPQCGREVPPSYTECPDCAAKAAGGATPPQQDQPPAQQPPPPQYQQPVYQQPPYQPQYPPPQYQQTGYPPQHPPQYPPPQYPPQQYPPQYPPYPPQYQQPPYQGQPPAYAPPPPAPPPPSMTPAQSAPAFEPEPARPPAASSLFAAPPAPEPQAGMPTWLLTVLCIAGFTLVIVGAYWLFGSHKTAKGPSATVESPAAKPGANANPWQKYIEISGVRFMEDAKHKGKVVAKFSVTNHSSVEINNVAGNVTVWASTKRSEEDAQGSFAFTTNLPPLETKEVTAPLNTKLKIYELPDWTNMTTDVQITSPSGGD